ncbi:MAG: hypothetical protein Q7R83_03395 [bacterium]|nr:hypothetical protein [bacterium]
MAHLLSIGDLLSKSWNQFARDWKTNAHITVWILLIPAITLPRMLVTLLMPGEGSNGSAVGLFILLTVLLAIAYVVIAFIIGIMVPLRLLDFTLRRDTNAKASHVKWQWNLFGSFLWIMILTALAQIVPMIAGGLVGWIIYSLYAHPIMLLIGAIAGALTFILPAIYLNNLFAFAPALLLEDDIRGRAALATSARLVRGRWWAILWRRIVPSLVFGIIVMVAFFLIAAILGAIAFGIITLIKAPLSLTTAAVVIATVGLLVVVSYALEVFALPYVVTVGAKLFHSLKSTR